MTPHARDATPMPRPPTTFMGQQLPPLRAGNVYALRIWPGGRREVIQTAPQNIDYTQDAIAQLKVGARVTVWLDDAVEVLRDLEAA